MSSAEFATFVFVYVCFKIACLCFCFCFCFRKLIAQSFGQISLSDALKRLRDVYSTIVIDNTDVLLEQDEPFLRTMQNFAIECGQAGHPRVIFVCGAARNSLHRFIRARDEVYCRIIQAHEAKDEDGVQYLLDRGMPLDAASAAVREYSGGNYCLLQTVASVFSAGRFDDILKLQETVNTSLDLVYVLSYFSILLADHSWNKRPTMGKKCHSSREV